MPKTIIFLAQTYLRTAWDEEEENELFSSDGIFFKFYSKTKKLTHLLYSTLVSCFTNTIDGLKN